MNAWPWREMWEANTPVWLFVILPAEPVYCRAAPHDALPCLRKPVSSINQHRIVVRQMLDHIVAYNIAQVISIPIPAVQDRLLPPRAGIASRLRAHRARSVRMAKRLEK
jgi:hypothetical protein